MREPRGLRTIRMIRPLQPRRHEGTKGMFLRASVPSWLVDRQFRVLAQTFVGPDEPARVLGHRLQRRRLPVHHVAVEIGRAAYRLARVIDDEVEARTGGQQLAAERLDARRVPQIEPEDLETVSPVGEIGLARISLSGVAGEARGDDHLRARAQQLERGLVADFYAPAGDQDRKSVV